MSILQTTGRINCRIRDSVAKLRSASSHTSDLGALSGTSHAKLVKTIALLECRYVPPEQAKVVASVHASISGSSASSTSSTPEVKPLKSLLGEAAPALHLNKGTPSQVSNDS